MSKRLYEIKCCKCDHTWHVNLDDLDRQDQTGYRGIADKTYRVQCPQCHTHNVITVREEQDE